MARSSKFSKSVANVDETPAIPEQELPALLESIDKHVTDIYAHLSKPQTSSEENIEDVETKEENPLEKILAYLKDLFSNENKSKEKELVEDTPDTTSAILNRLDIWAEKLEKILSEVSQTAQKGSSEAPQGQLSSAPGESPADNIHEVGGPQPERVIEKTTQVIKDATTSHPNVEDAQNRTSTSTGGVNTTPSSTSSSSSNIKEASATANQGGSFTHSHINVADRQGEKAPSSLVNPTHAEIQVISNNELQKIQETNTHFNNTLESIPKFASGTEHSPHNISAPESFIDNLPIQDVRNLYNEEKHDTKHYTWEQTNLANSNINVDIPKFAEGTTQTPENTVNNYTYNGGATSSHLQNNQKVDTTSYGNTNYSQTGINQSSKQENVYQQLLKDFRETEIPRFYDGSDLAAISHENSTSFATADLPPLANTGMATTEEMFIVGDKKNVDPRSQEDTTSELVLNPTKAPIVVKNNQDTKNLLNPELSSVPKFAGGTDADTKAAQSVGMYGQGAAGAAGAMGGQASPEDIVGGVGQLAAMAGISPIFEALALSTVKVVEGFNKVAESVAMFSPAITQAMVGTEVLQMHRMQDVANLEGDNLAELYKSSSLVWEDTKKILFDISRPFLAILVPTVEGISRLFSYLSYIIEGISDAIMVPMGLLSKYLMLDFSGMATEFTKRLDDIASYLSKPITGSTNALHDTMTSQASGTFGADFAAMP